MQDLRTLTRWPFVLMAAACCAAPVTHAEPTTPDAGRSEGIWKAVVPPKSMTAEFDSFDPIGVAAGARIKADCSLNWTDPDDGKRYCFSSGTSLEIFLDMPQAHLKRAQAEWKTLSARPK